MNYRKNPFIYGQVVTGPSFTNRTEEKELLTANLLSGIHTVIISPRRWGKTSLVEEVFTKLSRSENIRTVQMDLTAIVDERDFFERFAKEVIKSCSTKIEEVTELVKTAMRSIRPEITFNPSEGVFSFSVKLSSSDVEKGFKEILNLPETIAKRKGVRLLVALDEFQNLAYFSNPAVFQGRLRSVFQHHKNVSYCFFGSKKHMMDEIFTDRSAPFYQFGYLLNLKKMGTEDFGAFIKKKFDSSGKIIDQQEVDAILSSVENHPHYVQFIAHMVWSNGGEKIKPSDVAKAINQVTEQFDGLFAESLEGLSRHQKALLIGVATSPSSNPFSQEFIDTHRLGSTANISAVLKVLKKKDILLYLPQERTAEFVDPMFRVWLRSKAGN